MTALSAVIASSGCASDAADPTDAVEDVEELAGVIAQRVGRCDDVEAKTLDSRVVSAAAEEGVCTWGQLSIELFVYDSARAFDRGRGFLQQACEEPIHSHVREGANWLIVVRRDVPLAEREPFDEPNVDELPGTDACAARTP